MTKENTKETAVAAPVNQAQKMTAVSLFNRDDIKKKFETLLGQKAQGFITSVLQAVTNNKLLKDADPISVYNAAAVAATLDLPINQNLGFAYIIPYYESYQEDGQWKKKQVAQCQIGWKGFVQLAQRTGQFKNIAVTPIYEGQLISENPLIGFEFDFSKQISDKIIGFASYFSLVNGFEKTFYMSADKVKAHGKRYSKSFTNKNGLWETDFESMGQKTVLKLLLSKFAPLSIEMQMAIKIDQAVINDDKGESVTYIDHEELKQIDPVNKETERIELLIGDAKTSGDLKLIEQYVTDELKPYYTATMESLIEEEKSKAKK